MNKNNMKKSMNTVNNVLGKKFDYEGITREWIEDVPGYVDIAAGRKFLPCLRFDLSDKVYFEFWGEGNWEFTVSAPEVDLELQKTVSCLACWMMVQNNMASRLPSLIAYCKERPMAAA